MSTIIKGQNLRIFVKSGETSKCIAAATSCQIQVQANLEETSTKDSTDSWQNQEATSKSWTASTDALVVIDSTDTTGMQAFDFVSLIGTEVEVTLQQTEGTQNRSAVASGKTLTGKAIVQSWSLTAGNKENATYSISLEGNGALA